MVSSKVISSAMKTATELGLPRISINKVANTIGHASNSGKLLKTQSLYHNMAFYNGKPIAKSEFKFISKKGKLHQFINSLLYGKNTSNVTKMDFDDFQVLRKVTKDIEKGELTIERIIKRDLHFSEPVLSRKTTTMKFETDGTKFIKPIKDSKKVEVEDFMGYKGFKYWEKLLHETKKVRNYHNLKAKGDKISKQTLTEIKQAAAKVQKTLMKNVQPLIDDFEAMIDDVSKAPKQIYDFFKKHLS